MPLLKRANEQTQSEWNPVPEGLWRWLVGMPEIQTHEKFGLRVRFPLQLTLNEQSRLLAEHGKPPEDVQQSWRTSYTVGLSLGYIDKTGQYNTTKLIDLLAACLGSANSKKFRDWISGGGGPPRPDDLNDQKAELDAIGKWLKWWQELEVYGTVRHNTGTNGTVYSNFAGPMPVGSLPGQKDDEYQAFARGKLRAIIAESGGTREERAKENSAVSSDRPPVQFTADGKEVVPDGSAELPW